MKENNMQQASRYIPATDGIIIGAVYKSNAYNKIFIAMIKDDYLVFDATGFAYTPDDLIKL